MDRERMSPGYHIANDNGLISVRAGKDLDLDDLRSLVEEVLASEDYDPELPLLADLRDLRLELEHDASSAFSTFMVRNFQNRPGSVAVVVDGDMSRKLTAAIYWLACALGGTEVFDDYEHALKWLIRREFAGTTPQLATR